MSVKPTSHLSRKHPRIQIRPFEPRDFDAIIAMGRQTYPRDEPYTYEHFHSHLNVFPQGQLVAVDEKTDQVLGYAASLIVWWDDYEFNYDWDQFTDHGYFTNHDPIHGRTLYGADIMVHADSRGRGVGSTLYKARRDLCRRLNLLRIRAGARLRGYHRYADTLSPRDYVKQVIRREITDPTLTFQLKRGFRVIAVVQGYLDKDSESHGHAAVIEWMNHRAATRADYARRPREFGRPRKHKDS